MRVRLTVTLDIDEDAWETTYGVGTSGLRDDVRHHLASTLDGQYRETLHVAREVVVRRESSHRPANAFRGY